MTGLFFGMTRRQTGSMPGIIKYVASLVAPGARFDCGGMANAIGKRARIWKMRYCGPNGRHIHAKYIGGLLTL